MAKIVGKATMTSRRAGTRVQPISSLVLPWTWTGSGRPGRCRWRMTVAKIRPQTRKKTMVAMMKTKAKSRYSLWAIGPSGLSVSCGALLAQLARNAKTAGIAAHLRRRTRLPTRRIRTSRRVAAAHYRDGCTKMETPRSQTEAVQAVGAALPVLVDLHLGLQVDLRAEERLELLTGRRTGVP